MRKYYISLMNNLDIYVEIFMKVIGLLMMLSGDFMGGAIVLGMSALISIDAKYNK